MLNFSFNNKVILNLNRMCILKKRFLAKRFFFQVCKPQVINAFKGFQHFEAN